ncbi:MAG: hypothetical protein Q9160_005881 [Pyrenula sp. 1 TL-2023]
MSGWDSAQTAGADNWDTGASGQDWNGGAQEWNDNAAAASNDIGTHASNGFDANEFGNASIEAPGAVEGGAGDDACPNECSTLHAIVKKREPASTVEKRGHEAAECESNRVLDLHNVADKVPEEAWSMLQKASQDRDIDDFKDALAILSKAQPALAYDALEKQFRKKGFKIFLIGIEKEVPDTMTIVNLQGKLDCKYQILYALSNKPQRPAHKDRWPPSPEDNLERLADSGVPMDRFVPKCRRCDELGHIVSKCPQEAVESMDRVQVQCFNCNEIGHRVRDCPNERTWGKPRPPRECRHCGSTEHIAKECPEAPPPMACRNCGEEGHKKADCPNPANPALMKCRNCDEMGHAARECPKPRDYSRVQCKNCGEMGHTVKRCKKPIEDGPDGAEGTSGFEAPTGLENENPNSVGLENGDLNKSGFDNPVVSGGDEWTAGGVSAEISGGDEWNAGGASGAARWQAAPSANTGGGW